MAHSPQQVGWGGGPRPDPRSSRLGELVAASARWRTHRNKLGGVRSAPRPPLLPPGTNLLQPVLDGALTATSCVGLRPPLTPAPPALTNLLQPVLGGALTATSWVGWRPGGQRSSGVSHFEVVMGSQAARVSRSSAPSV